jgi:hypothetical protein
MTLACRCGHACRQRLKVKLQFAQPLPGSRGRPRAAPAGQAFRTLRLVVSPVHPTYIHCYRNSIFTSNTAQEHLNTGLSLLYYQLFIRPYNKTDAHQLRNIQTWRRVAIAKHDNTTRASISINRASRHSHTMAAGRQLPEDRNPMLAEERAPSRTSSPSMRPPPPDPSLTTRALQMRSLLSVAALARPN